MGNRWRSVTVTAGAAWLAVTGLVACSDGSGQSFEATGDGDLGIETTMPDQAGRYSCGGIAVTIDELENLAGLPAPDQSLWEQAGAVAPLSPPENWGVLASGSLVDRRPLEAGGFSGLVVVDPAGSPPTACVPVTALEPVTAWRQTAPLVVPGGPAAAALAGARCSAQATTEGITVYWWDVPGGASWEVTADGVALIAGAIDPAIATAGVLDQALAERLASYGPHGPGPAPDGAAGAEEPPAQGAFSDFGALGAPLGVARVYDMRLTASDGSRTVACGSAAIPAELPVPACTLSLFAGHPRIVLDDGEGTTYFPDLITVRRDGEPLTLGNQWGPPIDVGAEPGSTHHYDVEIRDRMLGRPSVNADCGSITAEVPAGDTEVVQAGAELFQQVVKAPYLYASAERDGQPVAIVMQYGGPSGFEFAPGHPADESLDPYTVHDQLLAAIADGRPVDFELDAATGLPRTWTIDGVTRAYRCVNTDTQPPDLRPDTACDEAYDLLSPS